jgi:hypothetical protein
LGASALSVAIVFATFSLAFADFVPAGSVKVLGVGRIQSTLPEIPVAVNEKFAVGNNDDKSAQVSELSVTTTRDVEAAVIEVTPVVEEPPAIQAPVVNAPVHNEGGWITTLATNYGTPGDGFLGRATASGEITTTTSMGVAHKSLPLGTVIELYCPRTGITCTATVNDRGPYDGRPDTFDFQMGVTAALGNNTGWYTVQYRIVG